MSHTLFGKTFQITTLAIIAAELLSLCSRLIPALGSILFIAIIVIAAVASYKKLEYGLLIVLAELFIGGKGYLFALPIGSFILSIRIALFIVLMIFWLIHLSRKTIARPRPVPLSFMLLATAILFGIINGILHQELKIVYFDANAWLYFLLYGVINATLISRDSWQRLLDVLFASASLLAVKTLAILFLFSHDIAAIGGWFYKWIRDTGVGEITYMSGTMFRVFFQSQLYCLLAFCLLLTLLLFGEFKTRCHRLTAGVLIYLTSIAVIVSQSRSYWFGAVAALGILIIIAYWRRAINIRKTILVIVALLLMVVSQIVLIELISGDFSGGLIANRFNNLPAEPAGVSRLNELPPLANSIAKQPFFGYGFGKELTYKSTDPRIVSANPSGQYTTDAFEWGYLDIWLKLGLFGLGAYLLLLDILSFRIIKKISHDPAVASALLVGLVALAVTNIFSPYLNHPLGIGFVLLTAAYAMPKN